MKYKTKHLLFVVTVAALAIGVYQLDLFVEDWRHGDGICEIHGTQMRTIVVHSLAGPAPQMTPKFYDAMEADFPNCHLEFAESMYSEKRGKIFVCPICQKNFEAYAP